jgi:hypothetical protein
MAGDRKTPPDQFLRFLADDLAKAAVDADKPALRITDSDAYVGVFKREALSIVEL